MDNFTMIPNELKEMAKEKKIKAIDIAVFYCLKSHENNETKACFPSERTIAKEINADKDSVSQSIRRLKEVSLISYTFKRGVPNSYQLSWKKGQQCPKKQDITILNNNTKELDSKNSKKIPYKGRQKMLDALKVSSNDFYKRFTIN